MTTRYIATVPVQGKDDKTRFTRIGVMWENTRKDTGEVFFKLDLDFPVGVTEIVLFPPKDAPDTQHD